MPQLRQYQQAMVEELIAWSPAELLRTWQLSDI
jgi:hypothetical protein